MRELTRSLTRFSWAMTLFGIEQMANLVSPRRAADSLDAVARSAEETLGPGLRSVLQTGDRMQRAMVDLPFNLAGRGPAVKGGDALLAQIGGLAFDLLQLGATTVYQISGAAWQQQQGASGWGPVQPPETGGRR